MTVQVGLEVFVKNHSALLRNARIGLVSQSAAVLPDFTHALDALLQNNLKVAALYGPEHGFRGAAADGAAVDHGVDARTGLPVYSLYGKTKEPSAEMLADVDVLVFDMQDVGVRFYTYLSTLFYVLKGAGRAGKKVIVLDRPNPLGGKIIAGPSICPGFESFIGIVPLPIQYGLTMGELAGYFNSCYALGADVEVVRLKNWRRQMPFDQTGLPWVPTSPAMPHFSTVRVYPGTCMMEGTNLSEGRGTALPFELVGAPWLSAEDLAAVLNDLCLPGVRFRPVYFIPSASKHRAEQCAGVQLHVTEPAVFRPIETALYLVAECRRQDPEKFQFLETSWEGRPAHFDLALGNDVVRTQLQQGLPVQEIVRAWQGEIEDFDRQREPYLLYE